MRRARSSCPTASSCAPPRSIATRSTGCAAQFGANVEQVAHRLTTLEPLRCHGRALLHAARRPGREHLQALCGREFPLLALRRDLPALASPHSVPDAGPDDPPADRDARRPALFTISRTIERPIRPDLRDDALLAIGLGCDVKHAARIAYADGLDLVNTPATPVGPGLRDLPAPAMRLSRDPAGRADAGGRGEPEDDFALSVRSDLGRDRLALERGAVPLREIGCRHRRSTAGTRRASARDRSPRAPRHRAGRTRRKVSSKAAVRDLWRRDSRRARGRCSCRRTARPRSRRRPRSRALDTSWL